MDVLSGELGRLSEGGLWQPLLGLVGHFVAFTLVAARVAGLVTVDPVLGSLSLPFSLRALLVLGLALVVTPALPATARPEFDLDNPGTGVVVAAAEGDSNPRDEAGQSLVTGAEATGSAGRGGAFPSVPIPETPFDYAWLASVEFALGAVLALGVRLIFAAVKLAGELIDRQAGFSAADWVGTAADGTEGAGGAILHRFALAVYLIAGGHLLLVAALLEMFEVLPVGAARLSSGLVEGLSDLVQQSFLLALNVSAPLVACLVAAGLALGVLGRTVPQVAQSGAGAPLRMLVGLLLLGLVLAGTAQSIGGTVPDVLSHLFRSATVS